MFAALTGLLVVIGIVVGGLFDNWILGLAIMLVISIQKTLKKILLNLSNMLIMLN